MNICLFEKSQIDLPLSFDDERGAHILNVLHKKQGDDFTAGIIGGQSGVAKITRIDETARQIFFEFKPTGDGKPLNPLKMIIGFPRPIQLKRLLRDIAALGISEVHLTGTELGEKSYMQSDLAQPEAAWKLLREGTVQAGSTHVPAVFVHTTLVETLKNTVVTEPVEGPQLICLDNVNPACALGEINFSSASGVIAAIGSERGWLNQK